MQKLLQVLRYCEALHARWNLQEIRAIFLRRYLLQNTALEMFLASRSTVIAKFIQNYFNFQLPLCSLSILKKL